MKVGLLRCMQTEDACPATTDFRIMREKSGVFEGVTEEIELIGINSCGGCPGKKAVFRAQEMVRRGYHRFCLLHQQGKPHRFFLSLCEKNAGCGALQSRGRDPHSGLFPLSMDYYKKTRG